MNLLIVDDHAAMRRLIGRVVSDMVSEIEECSDGAEQTREAAREAGACGYVMKENLRAIRELLLETGP